LAIDRPPAGKVDRDGSHESLPEKHAQSIRHLALKFTKKMIAIATNLLLLDQIMNLNVGVIFLPL
jgi:hypothetical protein